MITRFKSSIRQVLRKRWVVWSAVFAGLTIGYFLSAGPLIALACGINRPNLSLTPQLREGLFVVYRPVIIFAGLDCCPTFLVDAMFFGMQEERSQIAWFMRMHARVDKGNGNYLRAEEFTKFTTKLRVEDDLEFCCSCAVPLRTLQQPNNYSEELKRSLCKRISLHEDQVPLRDVIKKIQAVADINFLLDSQGMEEEGVTTDALVTIDVDGIQLKSALNLILSRYNLAFFIDNEVLKITSRRRQQDELDELACLRLLEMPSEVEVIVD